MRVQDEYDSIDKHFPRFAEWARGYHSVIRGDFESGREPPSQFWTSARLYLKNLDEKMETPDNIVLDPLTASDTYTGQWSTTEYRIDNCPEDFEKFFTLRNLFDIDPESQIEMEEGEVKPVLVNTPADNVSAISQALENDVEAYITPQFNRILEDYQDPDALLDDEECTLEAGESFYKDILDNSELLKNVESHPYGRYNYISDIPYLRGKTWVLGMNKEVERKVSEIEETYTVPPLLASRVLEQE